MVTITGPHQDQVSEALVIVQIEVGTLPAFKSLYISQEGIV